MDEYSGNRLSSSNSDDSNAKLNGKTTPPSTHKESGRKHDTASSAGGGFVHVLLSYHQKFHNNYSSCGYRLNLPSIISNREPETSVKCLLINNATF